MVAVAFSLISFAASFQLFGVALTEVAKGFPMVGCIVETGWDWGCGFGVVLFAFELAAFSDAFFAVVEGVA